MVRSVVFLALVMLALAGCEREYTVEVRNKLPQPVVAELRFQGRGGQTVNQPMQVAPGGSAVTTLKLDDAWLPGTLTFNANPYVGQRIIDNDTDERLRIEVEYDDGVVEVDMDDGDGVRVRAPFVNVDVD